MVHFQRQSYTVCGGARGMFNHQACPFCMYLSYVLSGRNLTHYVATTDRLCYLVLLYDVIIAVKSRNENSNSLMLPVLSSSVVSSLSWFRSRCAPTQPGGNTQVNKLQSEPFDSEQ